MSALRSIGREYKISSTKTGDGKMADRVSRQGRSKIMSGIRSRGNRTTEIYFGKQMWAAGLRGYRKHPQITGRPDFAWLGSKIAVFVDGCFWHRCPRCSQVPRTNAKYWLQKLNRNVERDREVGAVLRARGWIVMRFWECRLHLKSNIKRVALAVEKRRPGANRRLVMP